LAARLHDWWGAGTDITVTAKTNVWTLQGQTQFATKYVFQPGQIEQTRGNGTGANGPMLQAGCVSVKRPTTRYIGITRPSAALNDTYLPESVLIKNPKP
ncbi:MAG: hypothetical protein ACJ74I_10765, partial [Gaiellaceae bacterium]